MKDWIKSKRLQHIFSISSHTVQGIGRDKLQWSFIAFQKSTNSTMPLGHGHGLSRGGESFIFFFHFLSTTVRAHGSRTRFTSGRVSPYFAPL